jgi:allophanate hydrolase
VTAATTTLVVCGAHLSGQPLNPFLLGLGATLAGIGRTAPLYRMYALPPVLDDGGRVTTPPRPGLLRQTEGGAAVDVEVYELPVASLGALLLTVAPPLAIGHVVLADGVEALGFVCESYAAATSPDITAFGGWRDYLALTTAAG